MSGPPPLERRYRRLLACYPKAFRRDSGDEIIAVLLATAACSTAVPARIAREIHSARMPSALDSIAASTLSVASWECGRSRCRTCPITPGLLA